MRRCPKCGFLLNENDRYCENCGEDCSAVEDSETAETVSLNEPKNEQKEKLKKQWKIAGIVFGAFVLVFAGILALVLLVPHSSSSSNTNTKTKSSLTEPTTVDNSIDGKGYYYFDNKFNEETVDKFMSAFDDEGSMGDLGLGVEFDDFKYQDDCTIFGKKVSLYMQVDYNGKTGTFLYLDDENNVVAYSLTFVYSLLNDVTTDDVYKVKQTVGRLASWLYALSDYKSYDSCEKVARHFISEILDEDNDGIPCFYYDGYTMLCNGDTNQIVLNFLVTDSDFSERHDIGKDTPSIFQVVTEPSTTIQNTTEPESIDDGSSDADDDYDDYYDEDYILPDSGTRKLTNSDLAGLDADELELARNEIYAREGRRFNTDYIQDYFDDKWWYVGTIEPEDFTEDMLNDVEKYNVNFIRDYEKNYTE
ncbi:YARHG domain-containing protein [Ruminococcus bromii]|uniref:YARHG domain-containing protein n=1 Tax=Ruminococcus bromii TaxID=40518 RepID=UPI00266F2651|nr:YARHG domain-containing protein [Ruminococcus bromii]